MADPATKYDPVPAIVTYVAVDGTRYDVPVTMNAAEWGVEDAIRETAFLRASWLKQELWPLVTQSNGTVVGLNPEYVRRVEVRPV